MDARMLGRWGEEQAAAFLRRKGYRIVGMNFRCRMGEIDLIAEQGDILVFAEVKLRKNASFAQAREFVTQSKQERIKATAAFWLSGRQSRLQPRFDVIEIYAPRGPEGPVRLEQIEDAFQ